jgi:SAM-dependent methyltransferase
MKLSTFHEILTPSGQEVLQAALARQPREAAFLSHFQSLSRSYPRDLARACLEIAILRIEGEKKFPTAALMYFTRTALEQASGYPISRYRARRYQGFDRIYDLGCSIGGDTLGLAEAAYTIGMDCDHLRLMMAQANINALNLDASTIQADLTSDLPFDLSQPTATGLFFDPARRASHRRIFSVNDYEPPLSIIKKWQSHVPSIGVKISPGVNLAELKGYDAEIEFISFKGELKEAVLWFGELKSTCRRATLLPGAHTMVGDPRTELPPQLSEPLAYLYEPDPAILRAGLVRDLALELSANQLDPDIAYLTGIQKVTTPFARVWEIEAWFPFQLKKLRAYLRERNVGEVVVKKRGSPLQPQSLIRDLRLDGPHERVVFLTHLRGRPIVVIGYPMIK